MHKKSFCTGNKHKYYKIIQFLFPIFYIVRTFEIKLQKQLELLKKGGLKVTNWFHVGFLLGFAAFWTIKKQTEIQTNLILVDDNQTTTKNKTYIDFFILLTF